MSASCAFMRSLRTQSARRFSAMARPRVAVLYQALDPPVINDAQKPKKPGGYQDSSADIAFALSTHPALSIITPTPSPYPTSDAGWSFPDTEGGILSALAAGATHLWANTVLFAAHPLQTSSAIGEHADSVRLVGQPPRLVELYDDKALVNDLLRTAGGFPLPRGWTVRLEDGWEANLRALDLPFPVVAKPVRGRGSHGVKLCRSENALVAHARVLFGESPVIMVEEFLAGEEVTVTVMPPTPQDGKEDYWALPVVRRFNHLDGVAPYHGVVAVTRNSAVVRPDEETGEYGAVKRHCERAAGLLGVTAPIRIDVRRYREEGRGFALFDVNMKPNMTGPGRPGREDQASLSLMAAAGLGWDYGAFLEQILGTAKTLAELRGWKAEFGV